MESWTLTSIVINIQGVRGEILRVGIKGGRGLGCGEPLPVFWLGAMHFGLRSCFGPHFLAGYLAFGLASWPAFLLRASHLGLLSGFGPRQVASFFVLCLALRH